MVLNTLSAFSPNSWLMYVLYAGVVVIVVAMSVYYIIRSVRRAKQLGMDMGKIKKVVTTSATFSILPQSVSASALSRSSAR